LVVERGHGVTRRRLSDEPIRGVGDEVRANARHLRQRMTPAERVLWAALRGRQLDGSKFRRQHTLGMFILDFCCVEHRIVIELDGSGHDDPAQAHWDGTRSELLEDYGYRVLRFRNHEVMTELDRVLKEIAQAATTSRPTPPLPGLGEEVGG
jgi:very-short-patch-repair endonuclease